MKKTILILATLALAAPFAFAQSPQTADIAVTANVIAQCRIDVGSIDFPNYDPVGTHATADLDSLGTFQVRCTRNTSATILLGQGANPAVGSSDAAPLRQMANGTERLGYQIYSDAGRTSVWENATGIAFSPSNNGWQSQTIYGRIPQAQDVAVGSYGDTIVATVQF